MRKSVLGCFSPISVFLISVRNLLFLFGFSAVLALGGCSAEDGFRQYAGAVGPDLYSRQTVRNTALLSAYTANICTQAGLAAGGQCSIGTPNDWKNFVDMGLYDIDQRCDAFLDSLYYKDKTNDAILGQIADTGTFTRAILDITASSATSLKVVAAAFDIAGSTFRNTNRTLLQALDPTTVKSIVFRRQQDIKKQIYGTTISNKPQALHALRTYLRVCMPFTIEMEANALLTSAQWTNRMGESPIEFRAQPRTSEDIVRKPDRGSTLGTDEQVIAMFGPGSGRTLESVKAVQRKLCAPADGKVGSRTKTAVALYYEYKGTAPDAAVLVSDTQAKNILGIPRDCNGDLYLNYAERVYLDAGAWSGFVEVFNKKALPDAQLSAASYDVSSRSDSEFRGRIRALKQHLNYQETLADGDMSQITPKFMNVLVSP